MESIQKFIKYSKKDTVLLILLIPVILLILCGLV